MNCILGVDPGLSGALSFMAPADYHLLALDMPTHTFERGGKNKRELDLQALVEMIASRRPMHAYVEQVGARPAEAPSHAFAFGKGYGAVLGILAALGVPVTLVPPQRWKKALQVPAGKDAARARASQLLPHGAPQWKLVKHDGRAEASLIALYGLRMLNNTMKVAA